MLGYSRSARVDLGSSAAVRAAAVAAMSARREMGSSRSFVMRTVQVEETRIVRMEGRAGPVMKAMVELFLGWGRGGGGIGGAGGKRGKEEGEAEEGSPCAGICMRVAKGGISEPRRWGPGCSSFVISEVAIG